MTVKILDVIGDDLEPTAWDIYVACFSKVNELAANRHLMYRHEFAEVMGDERVPKFLALDDAGEPVGLATFSNCLEAFPLVAPEFFEHHWPEAYAARRIFYAGFVGVVERARTSPAFGEFFGEFYRITEPVDGLVALDICTHNEQVKRLPRAIELMLYRISAGRSRCRRVDSQSFWLYDTTGTTLKVAA
jgi:hypothetical protein